MQANGIRSWRKALDEVLHLAAASPSSVVAVAAGDQPTGPLLVRMHDFDKRIDSVLFTAPTVWFVLELIKHFKL